MKKTVKVLSLALVAMAFAVACNNNKTPEEPIDTIVPVDTVVEELIDSVAVEEVVVDEPVKPAAPAKKKAKKEQPNTEVKVEASKMSVSTNQGTATISGNGVSAKGKNGEAKVDAGKMTINTNSGGSVSAGNGSLTIKK